MRFAAALLALCAVLVLGACTERARSEPDAATDVPSVTVDVGTPTVTLTEPAGGPEKG